MKRSLAEIDAALRRIAAPIPGAVGEVQGGAAVQARRLLVRAGGVQIKIEVTPVLRGVVFPPETPGVSERVESEYGYAEASLVSFPDLYAGKLVAELPAVRWRLQNLAALAPERQGPLAERPKRVLRL